MKKLWLLIPILLLLAMSRTVADAETQRSDRQTTMQQDKPGAWLGVMIKSIEKKIKDGDTEKEEKGVFVEDVVDDSPAEKAGIKEGDQLLAFNNVTLGEASDLTGALKKMKEGDKASVTVLRDGKQMNMDVVLGAAKDRKVMISKSIRVPSAPGAPGAPHAPRAPRAPRAPMTGIPHAFSWSSEGGSYGMKLESLDKQLGEYFGAPDGEGVLVKSVEKDSESEKAGFKAGDVIVHAGKKTVEDVEDFRSVLGAFDEGEKIPVKILRKGKDMTIELTAKEDEEEGHKIIMRKFGSGGSPRMFHFSTGGEDMEEMDGLDCEDFDVNIDMDEIEDGVRQMRIILNGRELELEELKDALEGHLEELRENIDVQVDDEKVEIRTKKI
ncbi:MAG: PDZ domain-containing protein [Bacteroidota bacterium]